MKRRNFLLTSAALGGASLIGVSNLYSYDVFEQERDFSLPPLYEGELKNEKRVFNLNLQHGEMEFFNGLKTKTLGINAPFLGPTLRAKKGEFVQINVKNSLGFDSTLHWHGFELPASMDGGPHQIIKPDTTWRPEFKVENRASFLWYHSHMFHQTATQVYKGLAGMFIIDDEESSNLNLPSEYGIDDVPIVLQDRNFNSDGSFRYISSVQERMAGFHGNYVLINGVIAPTFKAKKKLTRFRILNGSNARFYNLGFSDDRNFKLIATDGGLLEAPIDLKRIRLAPGERVEIVVNLSDAKDVVLKSFKGATRSMGMMGMMMGGMNFDAEFDLMKIKSNSASKSNKIVPNKLSKHPIWNPKDAVVARDMTLSMSMMGGGGNGDRFFINGKAMDMNRIDAVAKKDTFEIWKVVNQSPMAHPFHVHNTQFKILAVDGRRPNKAEQGFKDTVIVDPMGVVYIMVSFKYNSDKNVPYMFHCHILEHEDGGMMGQFLVT